MAEVNQIEKEAETGINYNEEGVQQGVASPVDCWELIGSSPGSPPPEARGDVTALEEAIASACSSGSLLQDDYFGYAHSAADDGVLPISTAMADKQNDDDDGHSLQRSEGFVFLSSDVDAIGKCSVGNDSGFHGDHVDNTELMGHKDCTHHDDHMNDKDTYYHDSPSCSNLMCYDDRVQQGVDVLHHHKMHDEFMMYSNEPTEHADGWHADEGTHFDGSMHIGDDSVRDINQSGHSRGAVGDVCAFGILSGSESHSRSPMSKYETAGDSYISMQQALAEGRSSTLPLEETGREGTRQAQESVDVQQGTIDTYDKRQPKGFVYISWIWSHLIRWQTQLRHANTIWSVAFAAAVMGILVLGRGWQRLQAQNQSLRSQLWAKEKRITQLMFQLMQTKDALVKVRRVPVICVKPPLQIPQDNF